MFRFTHHPANWGRSTNPVRPGPPLACRQVPVDPVEVVGREVDDGYVAEGEEDDVSDRPTGLGEGLGGPAPGFGVLQLLHDERPKGGRAPGRLGRRDVVPHASRTR